MEQEDQEEEEEEEEEEVVVVVEPLGLGGGKELRGKAGEQSSSDIFLGFGGEERTWELWG